jgi:SAM-dependent methyltransferase
MTTAQVASRGLDEPLRAERTVAGLHAFLLDEVAARVPRNAEVLDVGCGTGAWLSRMQRAGYSRLHGIDLDEAATSLQGVDFKEVDLEWPDWQLEGNTFDLITAIEVIEHIGNRTNFLSNIIKYLRQDGLVLLTTPNLHNIASRVRFALTDSLRQFDGKGDRTHYQPVFLYPFESLLQREGLRIVHPETYPPKGTLLQSRPVVRHFLEGVRAFFPDRLPGEILIMWLAKDSVIRRGRHS